MVGEKRFCDLCRAARRKEGERKRCAVRKQQLLLGRMGWPKHQYAATHEGAGHAPVSPTLEVTEVYTRVEAVWDDMPSQELLPGAIVSPDVSRTVNDEPWPSGCSNMKTY